MTSPDEDQLTALLGQTQEVLSKNGLLADPIDEIKMAMMGRDLAPRDLKPCIGSSGNVSAVLNRRRPLSLQMIRNLHAFLNIPAEILIQQYPCER